MSIRKLFCAVVLLPLLLAPHASRAGPLYTLTTLPAGFSPADINNRGQIAGTAGIGGGPLQAALLSGDTFTYLGSLGGNYSVARALNDAGAVTGVALTDAGDTHGFLYRHGSMLDIGAGANALGINARGDVVGQLSGAGGYTGFLYSHGKLSPLGNLGSGDICLAWDINNAGHIAGESSISPELHAPFHPYLYRKGTLTDLGTLAGREYNSAQAINDAGRIAGVSEAADGSMHAFIYEQGVMTDVGSFGSLYMNIGGINESGTFVGSATTAAGQSIGFAYLDGALVDLNTLIDPASGWYIDLAYGINDAGQIVANACRNFECTGVRLDLVSAVPEPASALMLLSGVLMMTVGTCRKRDCVGT